MLNETITFNIWGRNIDLEIIYDCFEGEEITTIQKDTLKELKDNAAEIFNRAYISIRDYCLNNYSEQITDDFENIFRYIKPKQIYIKRSVTNKRIAGLLCSFRFDTENGLAVYIEEGKVIKVGTQDIIL